MESSRAFFRAVLEAQYELARLKARRDALLDSGLVSVIHDSPGGHGGGDNLRMERAAIEYAELSDEYEKAREKAVSEARKAMQVIEHIHSRNQRELLRLRYLDGQSWKGIASYLQFDNPDDLYHLHGRALRSADKIIGENYTHLGRGT